MSLGVYCLGRAPGCTGYFNWIWIIIFVQYCKTQILKKLGYIITTFIMSIPNGLEIYCSNIHMINRTGIEIQDCLYEYYEQYIVLSCENIWAKKLQFDYFMSNGQEIRLARHFHDNTVGISQNVWIMLPCTGSLFFTCFVFITSHF